MKEMIWKSVETLLGAFLCCLLGILGFYTSSRDVVVVAIIVLICVGVRWVMYMIPWYQRHFVEDETSKQTVMQHPCQRLVPHLLPKWEHEVIEDVEPTLVAGAKLSFPNFFRGKNKGHIDGQTMRTRAKAMKANYGLADVPVLVGPDGKGIKTIPAELRGKVYIVLTATVLRNSNGNLRVPYLYWYGGAWIVDFGGLDSGWDSVGRLVSRE